MLGKIIEVISDFVDMIFDKNFIWLGILALAGILIYFVFFS